jgi:hypothetical protein
MTDKPYHGLIPTPNDYPDRTQKANDYLVSALEDRMKLQIKELVAYEVNRKVREVLLKMLEQAVDQQRKRVGEELMRLCTEALDRL